MGYAKDTDVSVDRTRGEIERTLHKYGATEFVSGWNQREAVIGFVVRNRHIKIVLSLPSPEDEEFRRSPGGRRVRTSDQRLKAWEQACRSRWRALLLAIKAKLEAVEVGIATFEDEFLAYTVLPDGQTVSQMAQPEISRMIETGHMDRPLLMAGN